MAESKTEVRRCEIDDYASIREIFCQPKVVWGTLQVPFPSRDAWKKRIADAPDSLHWLVACVDGRVVASAGLAVPERAIRRRHVGELGMAVHDEWQGQGVGSELITAVLDLADKWMNLTRIELTVYTDNDPAIELYKRFGFEIEGRLRNFAYRGGEFVDAYSMARLRTCR